MSNNEIFGALATMLQEQTVKANAIADEVKKSRVDETKLIHQIRDEDETTDEVIIRFREALAKLDAKREEIIANATEHVKKNLPKSEMSDEVFEAKKKEYDELKKAVTSTQKLAKNVPGYTDDVFKDVPKLLSLSGGTTGTGTKRPRLSFLTIDGEEVFTMKKVKNDDGSEEEVKSYTFTTAAEYINEKVKGAKVKPSDLSAEAFATLGSDDLSGGKVEFTYSLNNGESQFAFVVIGSSSD